MSCVDSLTGKERPETAGHLEADGLMTEAFDVDDDIGLEEEEPG